MKVETTLHEKESLAFGKFLLANDKNRKMPIAVTVCNNAKNFGRFAKSAITDQGVKVYYTIGKDKFAPTGAARKALTVCHYSNITIDTAWGVFTVA